MDEIKDQARDAAKKGEEAVGRLHSIRAAALAKAHESAASSMGSLPSDLDEILARQEFHEELAEALTVVETYRRVGWELDIHALGMDALRLAAIGARLSTIVGYFQGLAADADNRRRVMKSQNFVDLKNSAETLGAKITDGETDHLSRSMTAEAYGYLSDMETTSKILTHFYYSIRHLAELLDNNATRESKQFFGPGSGDQNFGASGK